MTYDPYGGKKKDPRVEYEKERGEDGKGKYTKFKSKEKDEKGKPKHEYKVYDSECRDP